MTGLLKLCRKIVSQMLVSIIFQVWRELVLDYQLCLSKWYTVLRKIAWTSGILNFC